MTTKLPSQKGLVIWLLGLSGAGKTTIAALLEQKLSLDGYYSIRLDGDALRETVNKGLGFSADERAENIRRTAEMAALLTANNAITICSLITPLNAHRDIVRNILGQSYFEVFVDCPLEVCAERDVKGLYQQAFKKQITNFTGIGSSFEAPTEPWLTLQADKTTAQECTNKLYQAILPYISVPQTVPGIQSPDFAEKAYYIQTLRR
ncbi:adenylyl-sulfate kinase [Mucilaginibacter conchicola]|uniref:Adenylyl-sulfate kinase n=1 Tax=Mucilaginibacter conchicola TaxID=2303333 RepID=A0A372P059_9SPHI|nr:adenylyl-sulfate kinase [Mucilaginibacter conchicola]RFZ95756.1 adenylyl-sulfate kinase [Mucilaginibacter conchicola]